MEGHEILLGLHWHRDEDDGDEVAGIEIACECGSVLMEECSHDAILALSEIKHIAEQHRSREGI
jgi:hypothetical protein